jgi:hypothetical protein
VDFIERLFHVSPDAGSGVLEALYVATAALVVTALLLRRRIVSRITRRRADKAALRQQ